MDLEADVQIGDFRIVRRLGAGGMGIVYLARQVSLNRLVALKVLGPALSRESDKARFQREAQAVARLNHPGVAQIYFVGQDRQVCFIAIEYIDGISLREVIDRLAASKDPATTIDSVLREITTEADLPVEARFDQPTATYTPVPAAKGDEAKQGGPTEEAKKLTASPAFVRRCCEIVRDAALALAHAHEREVVHRDIKPENLLLDRHGKVHLIDFGIARFFEDATLTNTGALVGTPMYMSPEQVTGRLDVDHRTDIYSLGLVLYELLSLSRPILGPTREGVLRQIVMKALPPVSWRNRAVTGDLECVVHKATAKDPDERYGRAADFSADLQRHLEGKAVKVRPYRYRMDEREIVAARPKVLVVTSFLFISAGLLFGLILLIITNIIILYGITYEGEDLKIIFIEFLILSPLNVWLGAYLFSAGAWSRAFCAAEIVLLVIASICEISYDPDVNTFFLVLIAVVLVCFNLTLFAPRTREWFRFAARLRSEHRRHARLR